MTLSRRRFIEFCTEGFAIIVALRLVTVIPPANETPVRPPGALKETHLSLLCIRCGICLEACPTKAITFGGLSNGIAGVNTPVINPLGGPCEFYRGRCEGIMLCSESCPTGALKKIDKDQVKMGSVELYSDRCLSYQGKECLVCAEMCPVNGAITVSEDKPVFHNDICVGCGTCVFACPSNPKALDLTSKGTKRAKWLG